MAKKTGQIQTLYEDSPCPTPGPKESKGGSFGNALPQGPGPTSGTMGEVQYSDIKGDGAKIKGS